MRLPYTVSGKWVLQRALKYAMSSLVGPEIPFAIASARVSGRCGGIIRGRVSKREKCARIAYGASGGRLNGTGRPK